MLRRALIAAADQDRIRAAIEAVPASRAVVARFVAGETVPHALTAASALAADGLRVTFNQLGEYVTDPDQATRNRDGFIALATELRDSDLAGPTSELSIKLSALGQLDSPARALAHAHAICTAATAAGVLVTLDMEDHATTDATLEAAAALREDFPQTGVVIQAALHRSPADCADLAHSGTRVRLVKGAYREPNSVALQRRHDIDLAYVRCLRTLFTGATPLVATHDPRLIALAADLSRRTTHPFEYQMLRGVRDTEQRRLTTAGHNVRVYLPFGPQWYGYFTRRLAERPANVLFLLRALISRG